MTSSALRKLREWLNVYEAALYLSEGMSDHVSEDDVLRLAIDGHITLSLYLPLKVAARCRKIEDDSLDPVEIDKKIEGLCDVPMFGRGKIEIEDRHQRLLGRYLPTDGAVGALVEQGEMLCKLPPDRGATGMSTRSASEFPQGSILCVRRVVLDEFIKTHGAAGAQAPQLAERPLGERERATLLTIIAALAGAADIDISKPSKAAESIESLTSRLGARVSARTIEEHLKRIPDAIERKGKTST